MKKSKNGEIKWFVPVVGMEEDVGAGDGDELVNIVTSTGQQVQVTWMEIIAQATKLLRDEANLIQQQQVEDQDFPSQTDILTYIPDGNDPLYQKSEKIRTLVTDLHKTVDSHGTGTTDQNEAAAVTLVNVFLKNAAPNLSSANQLHMAQSLIVLGLLLWS